MSSKDSSKAAPPLPPPDVETAAPPRGPSLIVTFDDAIALIEARAQVYRSAGDGARSSALDQVVAELRAADSKARRGPP